MGRGMLLLAGLAFAITAFLGAQTVKDTSHIEGRTPPSSAAELAIACARPDSIACAFARNPLDFSHVVVESRAAVRNTIRAGGVALALLLFALTFGLSRPAADPTPPARSLLDKSERTL